MNLTNNVNENRMTAANGNEWTNKRDVEIPDDFHEKLPRPVYWRLLVMPQAPETVSKGGIVLTATNQEAQLYNTYVGKVLDKGPLVGERDPLNGAPLDVDVGDWIIYGKYAGQRVECQGIRLVFLNDEDILAVTKYPDALRVTV